MGPPVPGGHMGYRGCALAYMGQGHQPQEAHAPRVSRRKSPRRGRHLLGALGRRDSSPWPHHPRRLDLLGPAHPLGPPIYSGEMEDFLPFAFGASLSLSNTSSSIVLSEALPEYCSSIITTPSCCCWCHLPQPLLPLAGSRRRRRGCSVRVLNAQVPSVRC